MTISSDVKINILMLISILLRPIQCAIDEFDANVKFSHISSVIELDSSWQSIKPINVVVIKLCIKSGTIGNLTYLRKTKQYLRYSKVKSSLSESNVAFMSQLHLLTSNKGTLPLHSFFSKTLQLMPIMSKMTLLHSGQF